MKKHGFNIFVLISTLAGSVVFPQPASAQEFVYAENYGYGYVAPTAAPTYQAEASLGVQPTAPISEDQVYDNGYQIPPQYNDQYYPQEAEGAVSYYGTSQTSQVAPPVATEAPKVVNNHYYY